ncbi:TPA_asm: hypothetical protein [Branchiostoma lancelet adintovirus]|uniref:Uncharacterized protein n=1 Tax=Branchiostoma lancelet adintovirus TaxID=2597807 RepID=A0A5H3CWX7_9VIRU|nr:TPA_asm: hypothetical protein [Branchiostoma lancelet adintovirus]
MSDNSQQPNAAAELTSAENTAPTPVDTMPYHDITMTNLDMAQLTDDDDRSLVNFLLGELGETHEAYLDFLTASLGELLFVFFFAFLPHAWGAGCQRQLGGLCREQIILAGPLPDCSRYA